MINAFKKWLRKQQFQPTLIGLFVNPFYFARKAIYRQIEHFSPFITGHVLDVGCGSKPYKDLFTFEEYIGLDVDQSGHDHRNEDIEVYYDGKTIPFEDSKFDSLICFEVFEHVFTPEAFLQEISRVVKQNGTILFTVPFIWDEHEKPYDYARYTSFGLKDLFARNNLLIVENSKYVTDFRIIFLLINAYIYKLFLGEKKNKMRLFFTMLFCSFFNITGILLSWITPKNEDLYFGNIILIKNLK